MKRKEYRIAVKDGHIGKLLEELRHWHVAPSLYIVEGDTVITNSVNVVDVATETFINAPHLIEIVSA